MNFVSSKVRRPEGIKLYPRRRLFSLIDNSSIQVIWVYAPAGAGKTSLVLSWLQEHPLPVLWYNVDHSDEDIANLFYYFRMALRSLVSEEVNLPLLTREYLLDINTFTQRFFEKAFEYLTPHSVIVFDSCHEVDESAAFYQVLLLMCKCLPAEIKLILLSRNPPPQGFTHLVLSGRIRVIGYEHLRLNYEETKEVIKLRREQTSPELFDRIYQMTEGWAAGVVLLCEDINNLTNTDDTNIKNHEGVFEFFAAEVFNKMAFPVQQLLLSTVYLSRFTAEMAKNVSDIEDAEDILEFLYRNSVFITRQRGEPIIYQTHPLFRAFLRNKLERDYPQAHSLKIKSLSGKVLEEAGELEEAARLYHLCSDNDSLRRLLLRHAERFIEQGRHKILSEWIQALPSEIVETDPDIMYYLAYCSPPQVPHQVLDSFERAFSLYKAREDIKGMYRCLAGAIECILNNPSSGEIIDRWIQRFEELQSVYSSIPERLSNMIAPRMLMALIHRYPHYKDFQRWQQETERILHRAEQTKDRIYAAVALLSVYLWKGEFFKAAEALSFFTKIINTSEAPPLPRILFNMIQAWYLWSAGEPQRCIEVVRETLQFTEYHGIKLWDFLLRFHLICALLILGRIEDAESELKLFEENFSRLRPFDLFYYHYSYTWLLLQRGNIYGASIHATNAHRIAERMGLYHCRIQAEYVMAVTAAEKGEIKKADRHISKGLRLNRHLNSSVLKFMFLLLKAKLAFQQNKEKKGFALLKNALVLGRQRRLLNFSTWVPIDKTSLAVKAFQYGIETDYLKELIRQRRFMFDIPVFDTVDWPWQIKVYTLGDFKIYREGVPIPVSRKSQRRPLDMLRLLVAAGGQSVREEWIVEMLWGEKELENAHRAVLTTLHRLRKLLGSDRCISYQDGTLSIDHRLVWIDAITFQEMFYKAERLWHRRQQSEATELMRRALELYRGEFLPDSTMTPWTYQMRERLRDIFVKCVLRIGEHYEKEGSLEDALHLYQRGIEMTPTQEELYQRLMLLYMKMDRKADAVLTYQRCFNTLKGILGVEPSEKTKDLYRDVREG